MRLFVQLILWYITDGFSYQEYSNKHSGSCASNEMVQIHVARCTVDNNLGDMNVTINYMINYAQFITYKAAVIEDLSYIIYIRIPIKQK